MSKFIVYLFDISYFSGKIEAYLKYKDIAYQAVEPKWRQVTGELYEQTGLMKVPVIRTPEDVWLQDTTPMINHLENKFPKKSIFTGSNTLDFLSILLEDYADEWLWRPALYYRWCFAKDANLYAKRFTTEFLSDSPLPAPLTALWVKLRQHLIYIKGDGIRATNKTHVEGIYLKCLAQLQAIFEKRPFLFGDRPSLADFGFFASMFRHFSIDPTPSIIMRSKAPSVYAWVARMWDAKNQAGDSWLTQVPEDILPLLNEVGEAYLPYLLENAQAWQEGKVRFNYQVQGFQYHHLPVVHYRVWCLEQLQQQYQKLRNPELDTYLKESGCLHILEKEPIRSELHAEGQDPAICIPVGKKNGLHWIKRYFTGTHWHKPKS